MDKKPDVETLGESDNFTIWASHEAETNEMIYHIELESVTIHLFEDEWEEFVGLILQAVR